MSAVIPKTNGEQTSLFARWGGRLHRGERSHPLTNQTFPKDGPMPAEVIAAAATPQARALSLVREDRRVTRLLCDDTPNRQVAVWLAFSDGTALWCWFDDLDLAEDLANGLLTRIGHVAVLRCALRAFLTETDDPLLEFPWDCADGTVDTDELDGALASKAWRAAYAASSEDTSDPVLGRSVLIETYEHGVRFTGTDRYVLASVWCPLERGDTWNVNGLDEAPIDTVLVGDLDGRAAQLLRYISKLAKAAEKDDGVRPRLLLSVARHEGTQLVLASDDVDLAAEEVVLSLNDGTETVACPTIEATYPAYRHILAATPRSKASTLILGTYAFHKASTVAQIVAPLQLRCHFEAGGLIRFDAFDAETGLSISGGLQAGREHGDEAADEVAA